MILNNMENEKLEEQNSEVDVLVTLKSHKSSLTDEEIMSVPFWLSSFQFSARVATVFRSLIDKEGCKFLIIRKFQEKFDQYVTLKKGAENFLEDRAKFEAVIFACTQDLNLAAAYDVEKELGLTLDPVASEVGEQVRLESCNNLEQAVGGYGKDASVPFTCLSSVPRGPLPPATSKSGSFAKIPSLLRYDPGKAVNQGPSARYVPPPMSASNRIRSDRLFSLSFPSPPKNSAFAKEVISVPTKFGRCSRRGGSRRRSPAGRWRRDSPPSRRYNRSRSRSISPPSRKYYKHYSRSRSPPSRGSRRSPSISPGRYRRHRQERDTSLRRSSQSSTGSLQSSRSRSPLNELDDDNARHMQLDEE